jgi:hypothetical protein
MVHEATLSGPALVQGLLERIEHEAGVSGARHPPADDATRIGVDHEGAIDESGPGCDIGEIADPQRVRPRRLELPIDPIERARDSLVTGCGLERLAPDSALQAHGSHQARHRAAGDRDLLPVELAPDLAHAIDAEVRLEHAPDLGLQGRIALGAARQLLRVGSSRDMGVIRRRGDRQDPADRLDPVGVPMLVDEGDHDLNRRSSSAIAK